MDGRESGAEGDDQITAIPLALSVRLSQGNTSDRLAQVQGAVSSITKVENMHIPGMDVHKIQDPRLGIPGGTFTEFEAGVEQEFCLQGQAFFGSGMTTSALARKHSAARMNNDR